jgi:hypothetical protein
LATKVLHRYQRVTITYTLIGPKSGPLVGQ